MYLEPGRVFLRAGYRADAMHWFRRVANEHQELALQYEARYLAALAIADDEREAKEAAFRQVAMDEANPFAQRMLRQWALLHLHWQDITGAVDTALTYLQRYPEEDLLRALADRITAMLRHLPSETFMEALRALTRLPLQYLRLEGLPLAALSLLGGMPLQELLCGETALTDLSPLRGMPLRRLSLSRSAVTDISPLTGMPLRELVLTKSPGRGFDTASGNGATRLAL